MKYYDYIDYELEQLAVDIFNQNVCYQTFKHDVRWNTEQYPQGNLHARHINSSWYNHFTKQWNDRPKPMYDCAVINHSYEPIIPSLDKTLWDPEFFWNKSSLQDYKHAVLHSELNSIDISKLSSWGWHPVYWFSHAYLCSKYYFAHMQHLRIAKEYKNRPLKHAWIYPNRLHRPHRISLLEQIDLSAGCYSFMNPDPNGLVYEGSVPANSFDDHTNSSAEVDFATLNAWTTSFLHIVSETVWQDKIHFTEKIFKPIVLHQPFVVLQAPGSLQYLRDYGFKTFGDWWDESYDLIQDPDERLSAIADIINWIPSQDIDKLQNEMSGVLEHNYRHFFENIPDIVWSELKDNLANLRF